MNAITGKLNFHSETGTEGGYYTLQKAEDITYAVSKWGIFNHTKVYDPEDILRRGKVMSSYNKDGTAFKSSGPGDISMLDILWDDQEQDMARPSNTVLVEQWGYEGLVHLKNGDTLTIFEKGIGSVALWSGIVELVEQDPYAEGSFAPSGMACHHVPQNTAPVDAEQWTRWFFEDRWASLVQITQTHS